MRMPVYNLEMGHGHYFRPPPVAEAFNKSDSLPGRRSLQPMRSHSRFKTQISNPPKRLHRAYRHFKALGEDGILVSASTISVRGITYPCCRAAMPFIRRNGSKEQKTSTCTWLRSPASALWLFTHQKDLDNTMDWLAELSRLCDYVSPITQTVILSAYFVKCIRYGSHITDIREDDLRLPQVYALC